MFGSVRDDAASRRANIRLVEARNSRLVWAQLLDFSSAESGAENPAVQIARLIAHQLLLAESRRPMPANPGAGHHVLLGRARLDGEQDAKANKDAQELFETLQNLSVSRFAVAVDHDRNEIAEQAAGEQTHEEFNRW